KNAGVAAARNAAYPFIKGEYTLFVDSDDIIELDLCEKTVAIADAEQVDMTHFLCDRMYYLHDQQSKSSSRQNSKPPKSSEKRWLTRNDYLMLLLNYDAIWLKLWRSRFLLDNNIQCPASYSAEDIFMTWKALVHNPKMFLLPEVMYHYRINPFSISHEPSQKYIAEYPAAYDLIGKMLKETGHYHGEWKTLFLYKKLTKLRSGYCNLPSDRRKEYLRAVKQQINQDEQEYLLQNNKLKRHVKIFYFALLGSRLAAIENTVYIALRRFEIVFRKFRNQWRRNW
ncbi:MAG: glycosyltransferase, partial [Planctomycetaceae bacterium]|nr:glycosyltransferase [Planctomycetaceae bacterium]